MPILPYICYGKLCDLCILLSIDVRETSPFKQEPETIQWTPQVPMFGIDLSAIVILLESITNLFPCLSSLFFAAIEGLISKTLGYFIGWLLWEIIESQLYQPEKPAC